jgi:hypothetical protein
MNILGFIFGVSEEWKSLSLSDQVARGIGVPKCLSTKYLEMPEARVQSDLDLEASENWKFEMFALWSSIDQEIQADDKNTLKFQFGALMLYWWSGHSLKRPQKGLNIQFWIAIGSKFRAMFYPNCLQH